MEVIRRQFHGFREEVDGSFVTTEFVALWFLPLWPVASYKVIRNDDVNAGNQSGQGTLKKNIPIRWGQAMQGWLVLLGIVAVLCFIVGFLYLAEKYDWSE